MEVRTDTELGTKHRTGTFYFDIRITCSVPVPSPVPIPYNLAPYNLV